MLSKNELIWLITRERQLETDRYYICKYCYAAKQATKKRGPSPCVQQCFRDKQKPVCYKLRITNSFRDAAEFEARVAARMARTEAFIICEEICRNNGNIQNCTECRMKWARLAVEEEMENEMDN